MYVRERHILRLGRSRRDSRKCTERELNVSDLRLRVLQTALQVFDSLNLVHSNAVRIRQGCLSTCSSPWNARHGSITHDPSLHCDDHQIAMAGPFWAQSLSPIYRRSRRSRQLVSGSSVPLVSKAFFPRYFTGWARRSGGSCTGGQRLHGVTVVVGSRAASTVGARSTPSSWTRDIATRTGPQGRSRPWYRTDAAPELPAHRSGYPSSGRRTRCAADLAVAGRCGRAPASTIAPCSGVGTGAALWKLGDRLSVRVAYNAGS
jgi:hypothetical protein